MGSRDSGFVEAGTGIGWGLAHRRLGIDVGGWTLAHRRFGLDVPWLCTSVEATEPLAVTGRCTAPIRPATRKVRCRHRNYGRRARRVHKRSACTSTRPQLSTLLKPPRLSPSLRQAQPPQRWASPSAPPNLRSRCVDWAKRSAAQRRALDLAARCFRAMALRDRLEREQPRSSGLGQLLPLRRWASPSAPPNLRSRCVPTYQSAGPRPPENVGRNLGTVHPLARANRRATTRPAARRVRFEHGC